MKILSSVFILALLFLNVLPDAAADTVYLKNGRHLEGIIVSETDEYAELSVGFGSVKFYRQEIEQIVRSSAQDKQKIEESWEHERLRKEEEFKKRQEEEKIKPREIMVGRYGNHLFVDALLNARVKAKLLVDTGSSFVVLSSRIAKELNIDVTNGASDIKLVLADGQTAPAKRIKLDAISIDEVNVRDIEAAVVSQDNAFLGFDGLLGMSFLQLFKFEIDLKNNKLVLNRP